MSHNVLLSEISDILKRRRLESGITQAQLAKRLGVDQSLVSRLEGGSYDFSIENMIKFADALNMDVEFEFFDREDG
jgi:transcriptional regulator with XRE-family HTH domain